MHNWLLSISTSTAVSASQGTICKISKSSTNPDTISSPVTKVELRHSNGVRHFAAGSNKSRSKELLTLCKRTMTLRISVICQINFTVHVLVGVWWGEGGDGTILNTFGIAMTRGFHTSCLLCQMFQPGRLCMHKCVKYTKHVTTWRN